MSVKEGTVYDERAQASSKIRKRRRGTNIGKREASTASLDWREAKRLRLPDLRPSMTAISLRLPVSLLEQIKFTAHKRDVPYQSLIGMWLAEKVG